MSKLPPLGPDTMSISSELRSGHNAVGRALVQIRALARSGSEVEWLATETARYLERTAQLRHPRVHDIYRNLALEGDAAVVARKVAERLRRRLLRARRRQEPVTPSEAQRWADYELLTAVQADLRAAVGRERAAELSRLL